MTLTYKEAAFPAEYREAKVRHIMGTLYRLRSIAIAGLAGMGKSNVVRFIVSHPQVRLRYLKERADDYAFVHVDCAGLVISEEDILAEIAVQLRRAGLAVDDSSWPQSLREARRLLKEHILGVGPDLNLVVILDYFDQAAVELGATFFDYLFHLRNARPLGNLSYVFATRRPLGHLHELQELLDEGCVIGPLGYRDALGSIRRDEARLGCVFDAAQRDKLIACTGGHPGFLKNASELLGSGELDAGLPEIEMARQMLQANRVKSLCEELWKDLVLEERAVLLHVVGDAAWPEPGDAASVPYLERSGLLVRRGVGAGRTEMAIFCPLFEAFVRQVNATAPGTVRIAAVFPNQARIQSPAGEKQVTLSPKAFALLLALIEGRGRVLPADVLITRVYGTEAVGVSDAALSQLIKRLRGALDPPARRMAKDPAYTSVETIRGIGYRLNG